MFDTNFVRSIRLICDHSVARADAPSRNPGGAGSGAAGAAGGEGGSFCAFAWNAKCAMSERRSMNFANEIAGVKLR
jgi:hypothetical protein